jgi:hypothetical protein
VPEWSNGAVSKTVELSRVPRVRIPLSPPFIWVWQQNQTTTNTALFIRAGMFQSDVPIQTGSGLGMSRHKVQHLVQRGNGFQVRLPVPVDLQASLDRKELRWSVRTGDRKLASRRVLVATLAFHHLCDKLRSMKDISVSDARVIANKFYANLVAGFQLPTPAAGDAIDHVEGHQKAMAEDAITNLDYQIAGRCFEVSVIVPAAQMAEVDGFVMPDPHTEAHRALCEGIARAQREFAKYALFRRQNGLDDYDPEDGLFAENGVNNTDVDGVQLIATNSSSLSLGQVRDIYVKTETSGMQDGASSWTSKTAEAKKRSLDLFGAVVGLDLPVDTITTDQVRSFRDLVSVVR